MATSYAGTKILVTGADGFIGSHLTEALVSASGEVTALAQYNSFDSHGWLDDLPEPVREKVNLVRGDVRDQSTLERALGEYEIDTVMHLAAQTIVGCLVARAITDLGHTVVTAFDGADALDIVTRENGNFDLLLTDIRMPLMDGIALALSVARSHPQIVILLMTAYADQRERASNLEALIHDVVLKPFTLAELKTAVADALTEGPKRKQ